MIEIRAAVLEDIPAIAQLVVDTWFETHEPHVSKEIFAERKANWGYAESANAWRRSLSELAPSDLLLLVATDGLKIVGVASSQVKDTESVELETLYVDVTYQRSGVGTRLFDATVEYFRESGIKALFLASLAANDQARRFYEGLGGRALASRQSREGVEVIYTWAL